MKRTEAITIVEMLLNGWPSSRAWTEGEMSNYASAIEDLDPAIVTKAAIRAQREMRHRPSVAELREYARIEARAAESWREAPEVSVPAPQWALQWARARSNDDMRLLPEQALALREMGWETPDEPLTDRSVWVQPDEYLEGPIGILQLDLARAMPE